MLQHAEKSGHDLQNSAHTHMHTEHVTAIKKYDMHTEHGTAIRRPGQCIESKGHAPCKVHSLETQCAVINALKLVEVL